MRKLLRKLINLDYKAHHLLGNYGLNSKKKDYSFNYLKI